MAELVTLDEVKLAPALRRLREATASDADDEFLTLAIQSVSNRFERATGRWFAYDTYTEYFSPETGQNSLVVRAYPIIRVVSLQESSGDAAFTTGTTHTSYTMDALAGIITLYANVFQGGRQSVKLQYEGGYDPIPADIKMAVILQVAHEFALAPKTSLEAESIGSGTARYAPLDFLPFLKSLVLAYVRR